MVKVNGSQEHIIIEIPKNLIEEAMKEGKKSLNIRLNLDNAEEGCGFEIENDITKTSGLGILSSRF